MESTEKVISIKKHIQAFLSTILPTSINFTHYWQKGQPNFLFWDTRHFFLLSLDVSRKPNCCIRLSEAGDWSDWRKWGLVWGQEEGHSASDSSVNWTVPGNAHSSSRLILVTFLSATTLIRLRLEMSLQIWIILLVFLENGDGNDS